MSKPVSISYLVYSDKTLTGVGYRVVMPLFNMTTSDSVDLKIALNGVDNVGGYVEVMLDNGKVL